MVRYHKARYGIIYHTLAVSLLFSGPKTCVKNNKRQEPGRVEERIWVVEGEGEGGSWGLNRGRNKANLMAE